MTSPTLLGARFGDRLAACCLAGALLMAGSFSPGHATAQGQTPPKPPAVAAGIGGESPPAPPVEKKAEGEGEKEKKPAPKKKTKPGPDGEYGGNVMRK